MADLMTDALNDGADAIAGNIDAVSLHDADPGTDGSNELSGGSYARQTPSFDPASGGDAALASDLVFDVPGGSTVSWLGFWKSGTFYGKEDVTDESYGGDGTYTVDAGSTVTLTSA